MNSWKISEKEILLEFLINSLYNFCAGISGEPLGKIFQKSSDLLPGEISGDIAMGIPNGFQDGIPEGIP